MIEFKQSLTKFWALRKIDRKGNLIVFPVVDEEQIRRCREWREQFDLCAITKQKPTLELINDNEPKDIA